MVAEFLRGVLMLRVASLRHGPKNPVTKILMANLNYVVAILALWVSVCAPEVLAFQNVGVQEESVAQSLDSSSDSVLVARDPGSDWIARPTRTLAQFDDLENDLPGSRFGGSTQAKYSATGFFRTRKVGNRWWLVDPEGHLFIHKGVTSVKMLRSTEAKNSLREKFGTKKKWAAAASDLLVCLLYTSPSPRDATLSRMPSSA